MQKQTQSDNEKDKPKLMLEEKESVIADREPKTSCPELLQYEQIVNPGRIDLSDKWIESVGAETLGKKNSKY